MKKKNLALIVVFFWGLASQAETQKEPLYINLSFTVWQLENGFEEAVYRVNTPVPKVFKESWIYDFIAFDISGKKPVTKTIEKETTRFVLTAEHNHHLTIRVFEKEKERFSFTHNRPSTANYFFYGENNRPCFIEVFYSVNSNPIGLLSPGIIKK
jgi:hypothetical protein